MSSYVLYDPEAPVIQRKQPKRDCTKIVLTDDQQQWLRDHFATTLNKDCAAHLGISETSLHRIARQLGLKKDQAWLRGVFLERQAMAADANRGEGNQGKANLLLHGKKYQFRPGVTCRDRLGDERERQRLEKAAATRRETIRKERMRVRWGLQQQTKLRVISNPRAAQIRYCLKRAGYILQGRCAWEACYTADTHRIPSLEQSAQQNGIKITSLFSGRLADKKQAQ